MPRFGRRGRVLALFGVCWALIGWATLSTPSSPKPANAFLLHEMLPPSLRAALWILSGLLAIVTAFWPPGADRYGFVAALVMPLLHFFSFTLSWLVVVLPFEGGLRGAHMGALLWGALSGVIMTVAGWPEEPRRSIPFPPTERE